jgi:NDP-sugar pyrophosphorylase family protein
MNAMKAMILAAGEGTRLRPLTSTQPKPMLPVADIPTLEWIVLWLRAYGIREMAMNLSWLPETVERYFGDGARFGVRLHYSIEETILGTAGGVKRLESLFDAPFVLVYGDVLTDFDLGALIRFHQSQAPGPKVTLSLTPVPNPTECGIVGVDAAGRIKRFVEKPKADEVFSDLANAGVLIVEPEILASIPPETFYDFSLDLFPRLMAQGVPFYGWTIPTDNYLIDIGSHEKYARVQEEWPTPVLRRLLEENPI